MSSESSFTAAAQVEAAMGQSVTKTLHSPPISALVPPGNCQFGETFIAVTLKQRHRVSPTSFLLRFTLPDASKPLNLSTCACLLIKATVPPATGTEGSTSQDVIRPYTPISTNALKGYVDLLVKKYDGGLMSTHLCQTMKVNEKVEFKHITFNVKIQAPFKPKKIGMIVGGTGITPMIQALHAILGAKDNNQEKQTVTMLYGSRDSGDILGREMLDKWSKDHPDQFKLIHVLSHEPTTTDSSWTGARGFITKEMCQEHLPSPDDDCMIFVCGPPIMYKIFSGARDEPELTGVLAELGYSKEQIYKF